MTGNVVTLQDQKFQNIPQTRTHIPKADNFPQSNPLYFFFKNHTRYDKKEKPQKAQSSMAFSQGQAKTAKHAA